MALFRSITSALTARAFEQTTESVLAAGLAEGDDENALAKRVLKTVLGSTSPIVTLARTVPGFDFATHAVLSGVGEFLGDHADDLWPGDNRLQVKALRRVLKLVGPAFVGVTNATADVIEQQVNRTIPPSVAASPDGYNLDYELVVINHPLWVDHPFFPIARDDQGKKRMTPGGHEVVLDLTYQRVIADIEQRNPPRYEKQGGGKGQPQQLMPIKMTILYRVRDWIKMDHASGTQAAKLEQIKRLFVPPKGEEWTPETFEVLRAYNASCADFERDGRFDWLDHEQSEGLAVTLKKAKAKGEINSREVHEFIAVAFLPRIGKDGAPAGKLSFDAVVEIEQQAMDKWLGGEQQFYTKVVRAVRRIRRNAAGQGLNWIQVLAKIAIAVIAAVSWIVLLPAVLVVTLLVYAVKCYIAGLFGSDGGVAIDNETALWLTVKSGVIAFAVTWFFPLFQAATGWLKSLFPKTSGDWLVDIGRKISAFGLVICTGLTSYFIMLNIPPDIRIVVPISALLGVGVGIGLVAASDRSQADEIVSASAKPTLIIFGALPLLIALVYGSYVGNPDDGHSVVDNVVSFVTGSKWIQLALLLTGLLAVSVAYSAFKYRKVPEGTKAGLSAPGFGPLLALIAMCLVASVACSGIL